jgi:hypothetical protein
MLEQRDSFALEAVQAFTEGLRGDTCAALFCNSELQARTHVDISRSVRHQMPTLVPKSEIARELRVSPATATKLLSRIPPAAVVVAGGRRFPVYDPQTIREQLGTNVY